jgi:hypothetical protein
MAGIAGCVWRDEVVLEMLCGDVLRTFQMETFSVTFHAVARDAVCRLLGTLHVKGHARADAEGRKNAQAYKGENLARDSRSDRGAHEKHSGQHNRQHDQYDEDAG